MVAQQLLVVLHSFTIGEVSSQTGEAASGKLPRYKCFPPGRSQLWVPLDSRRAALGGLALYSASRPRAIWAQRLAAGAISLLGPRALPGRAHSWSPPVPLALWAQLVDRWRDELGDWSSMAIYQRAQSDREGFALLLWRSPAPLAFVKVQPSVDPRLLIEAKALHALKLFGPRQFLAPELLSQGELSGWRYVAMSPLPPRLHRPPRQPDLQAVTAEIQGALAGLPKPVDLPANWRPMHGDFAPWNLRELPRIGLALIDWEDATWGPPRADEFFYRACHAVLTRSTLPSHWAGDEAATFWFRRLADRAGAASRDRSLNVGLTDVIAPLVARCEVNPR